MKRIQQYHSVKVLKADASIHVAIVLAGLLFVVGMFLGH